MTWARIAPLGKTGRQHETRPPNLLVREFSAKKPRTRRSMPCISRNPCEREPRAGPSRRSRAGVPLPVNSGPFLREGAGRTGVPRALLARSRGLQARCRMHVMPAAARRPGHLPRSPGAGLVCGFDGYEHGQYHSQCRAVARRPVHPAGTRHRFCLHLPRSWVRSAPQLAFFSIPDWLTPLGLLTEWSRSDPDLGRTEWG